MPAALADQAGLMVRLADLDAIDPAEIVKLADTQSRDETLGAPSGETKPNLIQLAQVRNDSSVQTDGSADTEPQTSDTEGPSDTPPTEVPALQDETEQSSDTERDDIDLFADDDDRQVEEDSDVTDSCLYRGIQDRLSETTESADKERPTGRLGLGLDKAEDANRARQGSVKPVDPLLADFVGLFNPAVRAAITVSEGVKGFEAFKDMKDAQARGDQKAADDARHRMIGALLAAVPGGRIFRRGKAAKAGITGKTSVSARAGPRPPDKVATTGGSGSKNVVGPTKNEIDNQRELFANKRDHDQYAKGIETGTPLGFASKEQLRHLGKVINDGLTAAGINDATVAIRGSAVTGRKFDKITKKYLGKKFDGENQKSDFDFAIVSKTLFDKAVRNRVNIRGGGTRI